MEFSTNSGLKSLTQTGTVDKLNTLVSDCILKGNQKSQNEKDQDEEDDQDWEEDVKKEKF